MAGEAAHAAELAVTPHYMPILAILPASPGLAHKTKQAITKHLALLASLGRFGLSEHIVFQEGALRARTAFCGNRGTAATR